MATKDWNWNKDGFDKMEHQSPLETFPPAVNRSTLSFRCSRKILTATTVVHNPSTSSQNFTKRFIWKWSTTLSRKNNEGQVVWKWAKEMIEFHVRKNLSCYPILSPRERKRMFLFTKVYPAPLIPFKIVGRGGVWPRLATCSWNSVTLKL